MTGTLPRVVIVDDLDRAKVEQQRAFLRAILRFSRQMKFAVVVCMDEAAILASGLRKLTGQHITIYTDLPPAKEIDELPSAFDAASLAAKRLA